MNAIEIFVVVFGLYLGYWIVARLIGGGARNKNAVADLSPSSAATEPVPAEAPHDAAWYAVLNVDRAASVEQLRAAYQAHIGRYDPDKVAAMGDEARAIAQKRLQAIHAAYRQALRERGLA